MFASETVELINYLDLQVAAHASQFRLQYELRAT